MSNFQATSFISDLEDSTEVIDLQNDSCHNRLHAKNHRASPNPSNSSQQSSQGNRGSMAPIMMENGATTKSNLLMSGIFGVDDSTYDVNLYNSCVVLTIVGGKIKSNEGKRMSVKRIDGDKIEISIKDLFGVTIKRQKTKSSKKPGLCQGVELHTYSERDANRLKHKVILLSHPSEEVCTRWYTAVKNRLNTINGRPRNVRFYMDLSAGSESEFHSKVSPILDGAGLEHFLMKGHEAEKITKDIEKADLTQFDCVLVAGGDTLVHTVVNAIVKKAQFDNGIVLGGKESLQSCLQPIGVIPCGVSNVIAHTVHGTSDMVTAALDIVYGRTLMSDILSVSHSTGSYFQFAFSAQYGFGSNVIETMNKAKLVANKYQIAIAKGLTKNNLRAYNCDVRYKPAQASLGNPSDGKACRAGCSVCNNDSTTPCPDGTNYSDPLQEFDPLESSNTSSQLTELALADNRDAAIKGEFLSVSLYATCSPCDMAPRGLSKYTHIADGSMDLITVKNTERKEFMRFIKRTGNSKNQLDFPFVESHRVKEASFHIRMPVSWSYRDKDYSEINDQAKQPKSRLQLSATDDSIKVIADGDTTVISDLKIDDSSDEDELSINNNNSSRASSGRTTSGHTSLSGDQAEANCETTPAAGQVHAIHKYTETDRRRKKENKKQLDKEMKQKAKEEKTLRSTWYLDATPCPELDLTFRVHQKLVTFYGSGMSADSEIEDVFCLPAV